MALGATLYTGMTPTFTLTFADVDLTVPTKILVTFTDTSKNVLFEIGDDDLTVTATTIEFTLTQEQTLALPKTVLFQVNWIYSNGQRGGSVEASVEFAKNLHNEVME